MKRGPARTADMNALVSELKDLQAQGWTYKALAHRYGVSTQRIYQLACGKNPQRKSSRTGFTPAACYPDAVSTPKPAQPAKPVYRDPRGRFSPPVPRPKGGR